MKQIVLNCLPPALENSASPALSVLKFTLEKQGYPTSVVYWNLKLNSFLEDYLNLGHKIYEREVYKLLPFYVHIAIEQKDDEHLNSLIYFILSIKPQLHVKGIDYIKSYLKKKDVELCSIIKSIVSEIDFDDTLFVGFSSQFYQWIVASVIAKEIKERGVTIPVVIGGFGTSKETVSILENFKCFDFALWGEGEVPTNLLADFFAKHDCGLEDIPHISYRNEGMVVSNKIPNKYLPLDYLSFDMSDYFKQVSNVPLRRPIVLPVEAGRGCHWNKCHFCFLNNGYRFRVKSASVVRDEIISYIKKYKIESVLFLDNDLIGNDWKHFEEILDCLIDIRNYYNDFSVKMAEIITKDITYDFIKKISLANFETVQIGYESPSDELLNAIDKKNTLASNLFFIKWACELGIYLNGVNVLRNLLEEKDVYIKEGIDNLYLMRFYLSSRGLFHTYSYLGISASSRYYKKLKSDGALENWRSSAATLLPKGFIAEKDCTTLFFDYVKMSYNPLWDVFKKVEEYYKTNQFKYILIKDYNTIYYKETLNNSIVNEIEFEENDVYWLILTKTNKKVISLYELHCLMTKYSIEKLREAIFELKKEGLIYCNKTMDEIFSIINTELFL